jgi:hypothetical protein
MHQSDDYLTLAYQAEAAAARSNSPVARECWIKLAARYRTLAALQRKPDQRQQEAKLSS